jgi:hypothetical protein
MSDEFELPEKPENEKERVIGLIIAVIAVVLAIVSALGHETHNDEILAHVDAADQYAFYQSKKERHAQIDLMTDNVRLQQDRLSPAGQAQASTLLAGYAAEIQHLEKDGKDIKAKGDDLMAESTRLAKKAGVLDLAEIALQIALVLCSISILTGQNLFARMGVTLALAGVIVALWGVFLMR